MMKREGSHQLELFSQSEDSNNLKNYSANNSFLASIWNYEKTILIIIGIVIMSIISYSLGVERGKRLSLTMQQEPKERITTKEVDTDSTTTIKKEEVAGYIIQLASYKNRAFAQKEVALLKKMGLSPLIFSKGSYSVLCVGNFSNKEVAKSLLSQLKKRYRDCYIRRL